MDPVSGSPDNLQPRATTSSGQTSSHHHATLIGPSGTTGLQIPHVHDDDDGSTSTTNTASENLRKKFKNVSSSLMVEKCADSM